jgi:hypothetical protein
VRLSHEIDILIGKAMDEWLGDASSVVKRLEKARGQLQGSIEEIGAAIDSTDKAVKIIAAFDDALGTFMKVLKAL